MSVAYPAANDRAPMFRVSLILEALRARPVLMFWVAALAQGDAVDAGAVAVLCGAARRGAAGARGRQRMAARLALRAAARLLARRHRVHARRRRVIGVYVLSQLCVVVTYWAVFALGRRIVGAAHAAMAILLMAGISVFTVPTLEFGPSVLAMPLTALTLLFGYRALADNRRGDWIASGVALGLLLLTTYAGLILLALHGAVRRRRRERGRSRLGSIGPWAAAADRGADQLPASVLARALRLQPAADARARCPSLLVGREAADGMGQSRAAAAVQPCRAGGAGDGRGRRARRKARQRARGRAPAGRAVREGLRLFLRARAGLRGDAARGAARAHRAGRRRRRRSSCCPGSPSWSRRAT